MAISSRNVYGVRGTAFDRKPNHAALQAVSLEADSCGETQSLCNTQPCGHSLGRDINARAASHAQPNRGAMAAGNPAQECFQPSIQPLPHGNSLGSHRDGRRHG